MILMYHKVSLDSPTMWWVDVNHFYRQMVELSSKKVVYLEDYDPRDQSQVVITFDGIYKNILEFALPILQQFGYPFELFLTSDYLGKDNAFDTVEPSAKFVTAKELKELVKGGGRLQWHTKSHKNLKDVFDDNLIRQEFEVPNDIRSLDVAGFKWFAYPHGEFNDVVLRLVKESFQGGVSCNQGSNEDRFIYNRLTVTNDTILKEAKVVCIIASYNYGDYLIDAIESVLHQTILPDEILITDDCSDDDTQIIAESYVKKYPSLVKYNRNEVNLGIIDNFNKAVSLTHAEYIFFLGADNRILSNYIEECTRILDSDENIKVAYTDYAFFGSRARLTYSRFKEEWKGKIINNVFYQVNFPKYDTHTNLKTELRKHNFIHGSSMYKRKAFDSVGGYKVSNKAEDYNLFVRLIEAGGMAKKVSKTNLEYRQHSISQVNNTVLLQNNLRFYKKHSLKLSAEIKRTTSFEKSKIYRFSYFIFKVLRTLKNNYNKPDKIFFHIKKTLKRILMKFR